MYQAVLFDFDGTLADTLPLLFFTFKEVFRRFASRELSNQDVLALFGPTEDGVLMREIDPTVFPEAKSMFYQIYTEHHADFVKQNHAVHDLVEKLYTAGIPMGIFTGKGRQTAQISLSILGLSPYFEFVITGDDVQDPKPSPEGIFKALEILNVPPADLLFVGDSESDMQAARAAGVHVVAVHWLGTPQTATYDTAPDYLATTVEEFRAFTRL